MQKLKNFCRQHRFVIGLLAAALICLLVLAWARYDLAAQVDNRLQYTIVNDEYSQIITVPPYTGAEPGEAKPEETNGLDQAIELAAGQTLYGVRLDIATFDAVIFEGYTRVMLLDAQGNLLTEAVIVSNSLRDNTFTDFLFDTPYTAPADQALRLHIWQDSYGGVARPVGLWASAEQVGTLALRDAGGDLNATAAMQFITDASGGWSGRISRVLGGLVFAAVMAAFWLLFGKKARPCAAFLAAALLLGGAFSFVTPALVAPDEYTHVAKCYRLAGAVLGQPTTAEDGTLLVRECDAPYMKTQTGDIGIFAYKQMAQHTFDTGCTRAAASRTAIAVEEITGIQHLQYLPQTLGVLLARAAGLGFYGLLLLGRLANLAAYAALCLLALRFAPARLKPLFACVALLPMSLQLAASFSPDAMVLGLIFSFTALCLGLREHRASGPELAALLLLTFLIGPSKAIYLPVVLLCLMIPDDHLELRAQPAADTLSLGRVRAKPGLLLKLGALALAVLNWALNNTGSLTYAARDVDTVGLARMGALAAAALAVLAGGFLAVRRRPKAKKICLGALCACLLAAVPFALYRLTHMYGGVTEEQLLAGIQPNGDSIYTYSVGYVLRHLPATVKLLLRSVQSQATLWLQGLLGTALGEPIVYGVYASWILTIGLLLTVLTAALRGTAEPQRLGRRSRAGIGLILLCVMGLLLVAALNWTPVNYTALFGVQGRYLLPVLPLALLLFGDAKTFALRRDAAHGTVFATVCLTSLVLLQGYGIYAAWQQ